MKLVVYTVSCFLPLLKDLNASLHFQAKKEETSLKTKNEHLKFYFEKSVAIQVEKIFAILEGAATEGRRDIDVLKCRASSLEYNTILDFS